MAVPCAIATTAAPAAAARTIKLWTEWNIFWLGFFLGWPTALVLSIINWFRMGLVKKATGHMVVGGMGLVLYVLVAIQGSTGSATIPLLIFNFILLKYFQSQMRADFERLGYPNLNSRKAGIGLGILIGILTLVGVYISGVVGLILFELVKFILIPAPAPIKSLPGPEGLEFYWRWMVG